ncbi:HD-GYP domain-containing protein (c-di-GMP phosphodiesterase class II) [Sphingomonas kaistensis]|uniref:HD-GYP domain-containing protein (C-di-GMP phosphodiesterase class II) n=1 Tax=Sphingomonas kaistensis TaxID=298708 RepID=A0A7X5Y6F9_9SPHN|nr:HD-GYP domain-containing protein [Sphingomonas kaistensis]NJC04780.1 HD-GYP domain-containing protein (c-di-GMP phosphodiesterase class II) [Sphingomonas kaistensis]
MLHQVIPLPTANRAEVIAAFSYALDLTEGQPAGHCIRTCWIGMQVGREIGLSQAELGDLYYTLLLKDLGCSSNAARICELYEADDRAFKQGYKTVGTSLAATLHFVLKKTAQGATFRQRATAIGNILRNGDAIAQEMILSRCTRGADIARTLRFSDAVCDGIYHLDEHWNGSGRPGRLQGQAIPLFSRIALLAQVADVFRDHAGPGAALGEVARRNGLWFDPALVRAFEAVAASPDFWSTLASPTIESRVIRMAPPTSRQPLDDDYLDAIAAAFGQVIDAKSPFTAGHSQRVGDLAERMARGFGMSAGRTRWLRRAAVLHDVGKLGVSSAILEKPASLDQREWTEMRNHAAHTREILGRIGALSDMADVAAAHHERLDGSGYPLALSGTAISRDTRIITACDFYDALVSDRPYRAALPVSEAIGIMTREVGSAIDRDCLEMLKATLD